MEGDPKPDVPRLRAVEQANADVVELLERMLERARQGELVGVGLVAVHLGGEASTTVFAGLDGLRREAAAGLALSLSIRLADPWGIAG